LGSHNHFWDIRPITSSDGEILKFPLIIVPAITLHSFSNPSFGILKFDKNLNP